MIADTTGGADPRLLVRAAGVLVIAAATAFLVGEKLSSGDRSAHFVDERTGEIWACAPGGCQVND